MNVHDEFEKDFYNIKAKAEGISAGTHALGNVDAPLSSTSISEIQSCVSFVADTANVSIITDF